jgi:hypothetical protein
LRSEQRVAELIEENEKLRRQTEDFFGELKSLFSTIEGEFEADRRSQAIEMNILAAGLMANTDHAIEGTDVAKSQEYQARVCASRAEPLATDKMLSQICEKILKAFSHK